MPLVKKSEATPIPAPVQLIPPTQVEKKHAAAPRAYGRELSEYELLRDVRISVAGVVQAVANVAYGQHAALVDAKDIDKWVEEKARLTLQLVDKLVAERK